MVTDYRGHRGTLFAAREINLKASTHTRNLPVDPGIEPQLLQYGAHCVPVTWATEAGKNITLSYLKDNKLTTL